MNNYKQPIRHKFIPEPEMVMLDEMLIVRWDYKGYRNRLNVDFYEQIDWNQTLFTKINECRHWLHSRFNMGELTYDFNILTGSQTSLMVLDSIPYFSYTPETISEDTVRTVGVLMDRYVVNLDYTDMLDRIYLGTQENPKLVCIHIDNLGL